MASETSPPKTEPSVRQTLHPRTPQQGSASLQDPTSTPVTHIQPSLAEETRLTSPPPPSSSMTPPPTSQAPAQIRSAIRTPSPTKISHLSSPPPTIKPAPAASHLEDLSTEQLSTMVSQLSVAVHDARSSAAHYKLQYELLAIESSEALKRMEVELEMTLREVDVLQAGGSRQRQNFSSAANGSQHQEYSPADSSNVDLLQAQCALLEMEKSNLLRRLKHSKQLLVRKEGEAGILVEENDRLKRRIRENREHFDRLRRINGMYDGTPHSVFDTPQHLSPQLSNVRGRAGAIPASRGEDTFAALLLADQVLSQESGRGQSAQNQFQSMKRRTGHTRGSHSLSSLPTTPNRARSSAASGNIRTPSTYATFHDRVPQSAPQARQVSPTGLRRRESRESTISAPGSDRAGESTEEEEAPGSQASKIATRMLRRSQELGGETSSTNPGSSAGLSQSKLFGQVRKSGVNRPEDTYKRKLGRVGNDTGSPTKRGRGEGLGLGIKGWNSPEHR